MVVFRCNAGPEIGFGHLVRCRALAHALHEKGEHCVMVGPDQSYAKPADHEIFEDWIPVPDWPSSADDAQRLIDVAQAQQAKWLVLDDYRVDETYQLALRKLGLRWLQFDGSASKPLWADIILNASPSARAEDYSAMVRNPNAQLLLGPAYAILRPEFQDVIPCEPGRRVKRILLTFGGGDDRGANQFVLSALLPIISPDQHLVVISGASNPNNASLKQWIENHGKERVSLFIDPEHVAPLFASCDIAVMAGGTSVYEALRCGVYPVIFSIVDNQRQHIKAWAEKGCVKYLGDYEDLDKVSLVQATQTLLSSTVQFSCEKLIDSKGATRVAAQIK